RQSARRRDPVAGPGASTAYHPVVVGGRASAAAPYGPLGAASIDPDWPSATSSSVVDRTTGRPVRRLPAMRYAADPGPDRGAYHRVVPPLPTRTVTVPTPLRGGGHRCWVASGLPR